MWLRALLVVLAVAVPSAAQAITCTVSKTWSDGEVLTASDLNGNFTNVLNCVNGNLTNPNLSSSAGVSPTKLDDIGGINLTDDPNNNGDQPAVNMTEEIEQLRFQIDQIIGTEDWYNDPQTDLATLSTATDSTASTNLLRNGGFESEVGDANNLPDGWTLVGTPTLSHDATEAPQGLGREITVTATGAAEGIKQVLKGLATGKTYRLIVNGKGIDGADDCGADTTGGLTNASITIDGTDDGTDYVRKFSNFTKDPNDPNVFVRLRSTEATDVCAFDNVSVIEIDTDPTGPIGRAMALQTVTAEDVINDANTVGGGIDDPNYDIGGFDQTVYVPGPGYYIRVTANMAHGSDDNNSGDARAVRFALRETAGGGSETTALNTYDTLHQTDTAHDCIVGTTQFMHVVADPNVGQAYRYTVAAWGVDVDDSTNELTVQLNELCDDGDTGQGNIGTPSRTSTLLVEVLPYGN